MHQSLSFRVKRRLARNLVFLLQRPRIWLYALLSQCIQTGEKPVRVQPLLLTGNGATHFDKGVHFGFFPSPGFFSGYCHVEARGRDARITIGASTHINNNVAIIATKSTIVIGTRCLIGPNVTIFDSNFHSVDSGKRLASAPVGAAPVTIGDNVFIGAGAIILKGVEIGDNVVIAAGSVVSSSVPSDLIVAGNPAKPRIRP